MGLFFSCSARLIFWKPSDSPSKKSEELYKVIASEDPEDVEPSRTGKLVCMSRTCSCRHKCDIYVFIEDGVVVRKHSAGDAECRRSLVQERVSQFEEMLQRSRSTKSLTNLNSAEYRLDGCEMEVVVSSRAKGYRRSVSQFVEDVVAQIEIQEKMRLENSIPRLQQITNELVSNEEIYVKTLELGIRNYVVPLDRPDVPQDIREAKSKIFGNITEIYEFHANTFYPALVSSGCDILKISNMFDTMVANGNFYCYVLFTLNQEQSSSLCETYGQFFQDLQKATDGDKLGVGSFLLQPIQRLPRYQLLLNELIKELMKNYEVTDIKKYLGTVCKTEKNFAKMLMLFNESLAINEIASCDSSIDLYNIGQFRKIGKFVIYDHTRRRRYTGKLLYFEQCLVYTEAIDRRLEYRGHYGIKEFGLYGYDANEKFRLFGRRLGEHEVDFAASMSEMEEWYNILHTLLMDHAHQEILKMKEFRIQLIQ